MIGAPKEEEAMSKTIDQHDITARIRERAYDHWQREGHPTGRDLDHWLAAEAELQKAEKPRAPRTNSKAKTPPRKRSTKPSA
jgi:Protein of unknown function (DUF2934)